MRKSPVRIREVALGFLSMAQKINKYLFLTLLLIFGITFFTRKNVRNVDEIMPEVLNEPIQQEIYSKEVIGFDKDGYKYQLTPLYNYEISGLLVSKMNYRIFSIHKYESVFPMDLCLIWGSNVESGVYKNRTVKFSQDCRWCWVNWSGNVNFNLNEMSNNHLLINNKDLESKVKTLMASDQIKIKGKLVNVKANIVGKAGKFNSQSISWKTSATRTDSGSGACEVIYVEDIEILKKGNAISYYLFRISFYGLGLLVIWNVALFLRGIIATS